MLSPFRPNPSRARGKSWPGGSLRAWLMGVTVLATLPLAVMVCVQAIESDRPNAVLGAVLASGACLALGVLLAALAAGKAARDALRQAQQVETASRAKDEFLTLLGHELRNPLGAISAASDVLDSPLADPHTAAEARSIIARQTRTLSHMVNDLLDASRVIAGNILLSRQPVDLAAVAQRVHQSLAMTGAACGHKLECRLESAWTDGDAMRLEQLVGNLLTSAFKSAPPGRDIVLSVRRDGRTALVEVQDCCEGIPGELSPHTFDLSVQGGQPLDRRTGSVGIGLALVQRLVELHGGSMAVESSPRGSRFTVRLQAVEPIPTSPGDSLPLQRRRMVLVVDDNQDVLASMRAKLELDGHTVSTAASGTEGLSRLLQLRPEVSIVAIGLTDLSGFELARNARCAGYAGRMIALFGYSVEHDVAQAMAAGFDTCLVKPVDRLELRGSLAAG